MSTTYAICDGSAPKPSECFIIHNKTINRISLFKNNGGRIRTIFNNRDIIGRILSKADKLVLSDNMAFLKSFRYANDNVYDTDIGWGRDKIKKLLKCELKPYHKIIANSSIVYDYLANVGVDVGYNRYYPMWSLDTYSGRSKSSSFNIQGLGPGHFVKNPSCPHNCVLIHFDWICADIRILSIICGDDDLAKSFVDTDPYSYVSNKTGMDRDSCKLFMLKSINSFDHDDLTNIFPGLSRWMIDAKRQARNHGYLESILGRRFFIDDDRSIRSVLNGVMQGSVAHAMQIVLKKIYDIYRNYLVCEIHDSLVLSVPNDSEIIKSVISSVCDIMFRPLFEYDEYNYCFPLVISIGKKWKQWKHYKTIR